MGLSMPIHRCPIWPTARPISCWPMSGGHQGAQRDGMECARPRMDLLCAPYPHQQQALDSARLVFYDEIKPRLKGLSMADAILEGQSLDT